MNETFPTEAEAKLSPKPESIEAEVLTFDSAQQQENSLLERFRNASTKARSLLSIFTIMTAVACAPEKAHAETTEEMALRAQRGAEASALKSQQGTEQAIFKATRGTEEHFQKMFTQTPDVRPAISVPRPMSPPIAWGTPEKTILPIQEKNTNSAPSISPERVTVEGSEQIIDGKKFHIEKRSFKSSGIDEISTVLVDESGKVVRLLYTEDAKTGSGHRDFVPGSEHLSGTKTAHIEKRKFVGYGLDIVNVVEVDSEGNIIKILKTENSNGK